MPLASFLRFDPWTDQVVQMHYSLEPIINERDKMPFEVEPVYLKLTYYAPPAPPAPPAAAPAAPAAPAAADPATPAPAAGDAGAAPATAVQPAAPPTAAPQQ
jgi:hypothetical protein